MNIVIDESEVLNVLINELALVPLGFDSPEQAINQRFYDMSDEDLLQEYVVAGVVPTQNILGIFNAEKAWIYYYEPAALRIGSVRITGGNMMDTIAEIEGIWDRVIPDYPMQGRFLDDTFDDVYNILKYMNLALGVFAFVALSLAMIGLFGLAAFMAAQRTKEIGVRKVLGASSAQIARLLVWQFSKPVMWALAIALPAAFFASKIYLDFFADRIQSPIVILLVSGALAVVLSLEHGRRTRDSHRAQEPGVGTQVRVGGRKLFFGVGAHFVGEADSEDPHIIVVRTRTHRQDGRDRVRRDAFESPVFHLEALPARTDNDAKSLGYVVIQLEPQRIHR